jgi:ComF family protein
MGEQTGTRIGANDPFGAGAPCESAAECRVRRAEIEGESEPPIDGAEPLNQAVDGCRPQKVDGSEPERARAMQTASPPLKQWGRFGVVGGHGLFRELRLTRSARGPRWVPMSIATILKAKPANWLRRIGRAIVDGVLPPRCLGCGELVDEPSSLCAGCWRRLTFFARPWCAVCGLPFPHPMEDNAVCADCAREKRSWDRARAVMRYDKNSRHLILALKHGDGTHMAGAFGRWMHRAGGEVLSGADLLVPVPLHWTRLFQRRYNQAALLAQAIRRAGGPPAAVDWLVRRRRTPPQGRLGVLARGRNVRSAFAVRRGCDVAGKRIVIVDDVMTTGATLDECARVLRRAGAESIAALTLARALRSGA